CSLVALTVCFHSMYDEKEVEYGENSQQSCKTRSIRATALDRSPGSSLVSRLEPQRPGLERRVGGGHSLVAYGRCAAPASARRRGRDPRLQRRHQYGRIRFSHHLGGPDLAQEPKRNR